MKKKLILIFWVLTIPLLCHAERNSDTKTAYLTYYAQALQKLADDPSQKELFKKIIEEFQYPKESVMDGQKVDFGDLKELIDDDLEEEWKEITSLEHQNSIGESPGTLFKRSIDKDKNELHGFNSIRGYLLVFTKLLNKEPNPFKTTSKNLYESLSNSLNHNSEFKFTKALPTSSSLNKSIDNLNLLTDIMQVEWQVKNKTNTSAPNPPPKTPTEEEIDQIGVISETVEILSRKYQTLKHFVLIYLLFILFIVWSNTRHKKNSKQAIKARSDQGKEKITPLQNNKSFRKETPSVFSVTKKKLFSIFQKKEEDKPAEAISTADDDDDGNPIQEPRDESSTSGRTSLNSASGPKTSPEKSTHEKAEEKQTSEETKLLNESIEDQDTKEGSRENPDIDTKIEALPRENAPLNSGITKQTPKPENLNVIVNRILIEKMIYLERKHLKDKWKAFQKKYNAGIEELRTQEQSLSKFFNLCYDLRKSIASHQPLYSSFISMLEPIEKHDTQLHALLAIPVELKNEPPTENLTKEIKLLKDRQYLIFLCDNSNTFSDLLKFNSEMWIREKFLDFADLLLIEYQKKEFEWGEDNDLREAKLIHDKILNKFNLDSIPIVLGRTRFDPKLHIGRSSAHDMDMPDETIVAVVKNGFCQKDGIVIQQPEVIVNRF